jgi:Bacterial regulatory proteins, lacI family/Periplasmic binding proteins and sugar binding domain of LacI family
MNRRRARPRRPGRQAGVATVKDIAAVGVSLASVSKVLNGRPTVGAKIRARVRRVAQEVGYRPNRAAQAMRAVRTRASGLVLPDLTNPFFVGLALPVEYTARGAGLLVCLIDSEGKVEGEADGFSLLLQHAVDGVICCPVGPMPPTLRHFVRPVVLIDRPRPDYDVVQSDYVMGGRLLAEFALRTGHTCVRRRTSARPQHRLKDQRRLRRCPDRRRGQRAGSPRLGDADRLRQPPDRDQRHPLPVAALHPGACGSLSDRLRQHPLDRSRHTAPHDHRPAGRCHRRQGGRADSGSDVRHHAAQPTNPV